MFSFVFIISLSIVFAAHLENGTLRSSRRTSIFGIMGGHIVDIEEYPYQVSLELEMRHLCGGSIISEKFILIAAHCVYDTWDNYIELYRVRYGSNYSDRGGKFAAIIRMVRHEKFVYELYDYDIAIVELRKCLVFDAKCQPIRLPKGNQVIADGTLLTVSGYGITQERINDHKLRAVKISKANHALCAEQYVERNIVITPRMICAGYEKGGKDSCGGDSGGPLVVGDTQVGIVSFGTPCTPNEVPSVYTSVAPLRCWILEHTGV